MNKVTPEMKSRIVEMNKQGYNREQIAIELSLSPSAIRYHLDPRAKESIDKWKKSHPAAVIAGWRKYVAKHPDYRKHKSLESIAHNKEYMIEWRRNHPGYYGDMRREWRQDLIARLGGKCSECGNDDYRLLQINHIYGHGLEEVQKIGGRRQLYKDIFYRKRGLEGLNLLCGNCNILHDYKIGTRSHERPEHVEVVRLLGGKCAECGNSDTHVLQINHLNGGGGKEYKGENSHYCSSILKGERTTDDLNILCANCNILYEYKMGRMKETPDSTEYDE